MSVVPTPEGPMYRVHGAGKGRNTSVLLELNMAARVAMQVWYVEQAGGDLYLNEGNRPRGVPSDRNARSSSQTASGESTQYFQHGRYLRGETPSAINPDVRDSNHTGGRALDSNAPTARDMRLRAEGAYLAGLVFNVPSESWHQEPLATPRESLASWIKFVQGETETAKPSPAKPNPNRLKEIPTMFLATENDVPKNTAKTFLFTETKGAIHLKKTEQVAAWLTIFGALGIKGPGFEKSVELPWATITHASESLQGK